MIRRSDNRRSSLNRIRVDPIYFTALQEELCLHLEAQKVKMIEIIVIDHAEKPPLQ